MKRIFTGTVVFLLIMMLVIACAAPTPTIAPTKPAAVPTTAPAATKPAAAAATTAPAPAATKPAAVAATAAPVAKIKRGGHLRVHRQNDWDLMDPHLAQSGRMDMLMVYDSLVDLQKDEKTGKFVPVPLLSSWDLSNPKSVVFKLQKGVKFHDGSDFNASVAKWNLDRLREHPKSMAKEYTAAHESVEVIDNETFRLNLKYPSGSVLVNLTHAPDDRPMMASKAFWEKEGDEGMFKKSVGTGPFTFEEWKSASHVVYKKFPNYWMKGDDGQPLPYLDQITVRYIQDWSVAVVELKAGNLDYMYEIAGKDVSGLKATPNLVYKEWPWQFTTYMFAINARPGSRLEGDKMKPIRQAILQSIDKKQVAETLGLGIGRPAYYHLGSGHIGYNESVPKYDYAPDKVKQLLTQAGYPNGFDMTLDIISRPEDIQNAQIFKQMMEKSGIRFEILQAERVAWVQKMLQGGKWEMATLRSGVRADPDQVLGFRFDTKGSGNYSGLSDPELDKCLEEGRSTNDVEKRQKTYERCQTLSHELAYYGYNWYRIFNQAHTKRLQGMPDRWSGTLYVTKAWLE